MAHELFDFSKLRGRMVEKFGSVSGFSNAINCAIPTVSAKINNHIGITRADVMEWSQVLEIPPEEIGTYFFTTKV